VTDVTDSTDSPTLPSPSSDPIAWSLLPDSAAANDAGQLQIGGCDTLELAAEFGTPLFVYDEQHIRTRCREAMAAFDGGAVYAAKAFLCSAMVKLMAEEQLYLDVATGGELFVALSNNFPADRIFMHGNNKSVMELRQAVALKVGRIVVDNFTELKMLELLHRELDINWQIPILLRITPGIEAHTHEYITTGMDDSKFGFTVSLGLAEQAVELALNSPLFDLRGIHAHIGSQVFNLDSLSRASQELANFIQPLGLPELSVGGGLGVPYVAGETAPSITEWGAAVKDKTQGFQVKIWAEPGRAIVAGAAVTLYRVGVIKQLPGIRNYLSVDGGMSDNPRPVLYGSGYEAFLPHNVEAVRPAKVRIVGKHCESGDVLVHDARLPSEVQTDDILATPVTGAYGYAMASNYNKVFRPAVVFVNEGEARVVVRRETLEDLMRLDA